MATIIYRTLTSGVTSPSTTKNSPLTNLEIDTNFKNLDTAISTSTSAANILSALITVDGTGSGLDADFLDGLNTSSTDTTGNTVVSRSSGNFSAGTITASLSGTASKATNIVGGNGTTLLGSIPYQSGTDTTTLLSPNTTTTRKFLRQTGSGTNGAVPAWDTLVDGDIPTTLTSKTVNGVTLATISTGISVSGGSITSKTFQCADNIALQNGGSGSTVFYTLPGSNATLASLAGNESLTNKTYNGLTITSSTGTLTIAAAKTVSINNTITLSATADGNSLNIGTGGTLGSAAFQNTTAFQAAGSYAASGANSDITSLSGLSTALSVGQGGTGVKTFTYGVLTGSGTAALSTVTPGGVPGNVLQTTDGSTWTSQPSIQGPSNLSTTLSGSSTTVTTSIPSWAKRITITFTNVTVTAGDFVVRVTTSTTPVTTGYVSSGGSYGGSNSAGVVTGNTNGFIMRTQNSTGTNIATMTLVKAEQGVNPAATWFATHNIASTSTAYVGSGVGIIANPGATVTGFAIASQTGAGTLGGAVNFTYE